MAAAAVAAAAAEPPPPRAASAVATSAAAAESPATTSAEAAMPRHHRSGRAADATSRWSALNTGGGRLRSATASFPYRSCKAASDPVGRVLLNDVQMSTKPRQFRLGRVIPQRCQTAGLLPAEVEKLFRTADDDRRPT
jgi:hypothetical protein